METAKPGSKLAQLQALRNVRVTPSRRAYERADMDTRNAELRALAASLEAENKRLKAEIANLKSNVTSNRNANAGRQRRWRAKHKRS